METLQTNQLNLSTQQMRMIETALLARSGHLWNLVFNEKRESMRGVAEQYTDLWKEVRAQLGRPDWEGSDS
jgi:hypothetical protein